MITFLEAKRAGLFGQGKIVPTVVVGVTIGVVALPLVMAFAIASGAQPDHGLCKRQNLALCGAWA